MRVTRRHPACLSRLVPALSHDFRTQHRLDNVVEQVAQRPESGTASASGIGYLKRL